MFYLDIILSHRNTNFNRQNPQNNKLFLLDFCAFCIKCIVHPLCKITNSE
nr:MAG TPA: hypothetical protein [Caudoviricetes sp.]